MNYFGPSGSGRGGKPVGCMPFFEFLGTIQRSEMDRLLEYSKDLESRMGGGQEEESEEGGDTVYDRLVGLVSKLSVAMTSPE